MTPEVHFPDTPGEAVSLMREHDAVLMAGATWIMRGPLRGETFAAAYVALGRVVELRGISAGDDGLAIGAGVTHDALAAALVSRSAFRGLHDAAANSANPAVRGMATVGGALGAANFPSSDLLPALLALEADIELLDAPEQRRVVTLREYLRSRDQLRGALVTSVRVASAPHRSAHRRLCLRRGGGDYPVAIVDVAVTAADELRIAVGSVGPVAQRWLGLEEALARGRRDVATVRAAAEGLTAELEPRDGVEAASWYRAHVVTGLVAQAVDNLRDQS